MADRTRLEALRAATEHYLAALGSMQSELRDGAEEGHLRDEVRTALVEGDMGTPASILRATRELLER